MPRMDGYTAVTELRQRNYTLPIIAITGNSAESELKRCEEVGYTDILVKPVHLNTLTSTILRCLEQQPSMP